MKRKPKGRLTRGRTRLEIIRLSSEALERILQLNASPPAPTPTLLAAVRRHRALFGR